MHHICGPLHYTYACTCTRAQCPTYVHYVDLIPAADTEILFPERQGAWSGGSHSEYWQVFWPMTLNKQSPWTMVWASLFGCMSKTSVQQVWQDRVKQLSTTPLTSFEQRSNTAAPMHRDTARETVVNKDSRRKGLAARGVQTTKNLANGRVSAFAACLPAGLPVTSTALTDRRQRWANIQRWESDVDLEPGRCDTKANKVVRLKTGRLRNK